MSGLLAGQRVWVTGGCGFLGRHVVPRLTALGAADVLAPPSSEYDLVDRGAARRAYSELSPDIVVHLAATVGGIGANQNQPGRFFHDNLAMGLNVIDEAQCHDISRVIVVGTVCAYPSEARVPFREEALWHGFPEPTNAPYAIAKRALLVMGEAYREQYGLEFTYLLPVNLYGPHDHADLETSHVIPALIRKCVEAVERGHDEVEVWGTGRPTREFLYVEDCADAIARAADHPCPGEPVNLGAGAETSIGELAAMIAEEVGFGGRFRFNSARPDGQLRRRVDTSRAETHFGWRATTPLRKGLRSTIAWYRHAAANRS